jgi:L-alanine-DL-glutamate epimerase-like enolase superfamily enzyme
MPLMLDANQCWDLPEALRRLQAFERYHPYWIEEPLPPEDVSGHARLRRLSSIPVAVGENLYTSHQFLRYLEAEAVDILQPDVVRVGGITEFLKIAHLCEAWHRMIAPHFMSEISVHLLCAIPNGLFLENVRGGTLKDLGLTNVSIVQDGLGRPPECEGIGFQLDFSKLAPFALDGLKGSEQRLDQNSLSFS